MYNAEDVPCSGLQGYDVREVLDGKVGIADMASEILDDLTVATTNIDDKVSRLVYRLPVERRQHRAEIPGVVFGEEMHSAVETPVSLRLASQRCVDTLFGPAIQRECTLRWLATVLAIFVPHIDKFG